MGLDNFRSDSSDQTETSSDSENSGEKDSTEEELSGLMSFKTDEKQSESSDNGKEYPSVSWRKDFTADEWNNMPTEEKAKYVRSNYFPGYRPEIQIDNDWDYKMVIELKCECDNSFTFQSDGICMSCGRTYMCEDGVVVKKGDPHNE